MSTKQGVAMNASHWGGGGGGEFRGSRAQTSSGLPTPAFQTSRNISGRAWWYRPVTPGSQEDKAVGPQVQIQLGLQSGFKDSLGSLVRPLVSKSKVKERLKDIAQ